MAKRKMSMAEKRKRRQAKTRSTENPFESLPVSKLDFKSQPPPKQQEDDLPQKRAETPTAEAEKARGLLQSQRESVTMLTMVREQVERLGQQDNILSGLERDGYFVFDGFLNNETTTECLAKEARSMFDAEDMETDASNLGSGEYIFKITGGDRYTKCPRSVELVVSTTRHVPEVFETVMSLDASACMATMRGFDYKSLKASMALLLGSDDEEISDSSKKFGKVVLKDDDDDDKRKLTMFYYLVPESWDEGCGGGLTFASSSGESSVIAAKRDRLVIWKSDTTMFKKNTWKGNEESNDFGACVELHLVGKAKDKDN
jgi:hypothetical protein